MNINLQGRMIPDAVTGTWFEVGEKAEPAGIVPNMKVNEEREVPAGKHQIGNKNRVLRFLAKWLH